MTIESTATSFGVGTAADIGCVRATWNVPAGTVVTWSSRATETVSKRRYWDDVVQAFFLGASIATFVCGVITHGFGVA